MVTNAGGSFDYTMRTNPTETKKTLSSSRNMVITNYDTRKGELKDQPNNSFMIRLDNGKSTINYKYSNGVSGNLKTVDLSPTRYSVFNALAGLDGDVNNISDTDLCKANTLVGKHGIKEVRRDLGALVVSIIFGDGVVLRIDAESDSEVQQK